MDRQIWLLAAAILGGLNLLQAVNAIATITATGSKLFDANGNQFFIKGVVYQQADNDLLANASQCALDVTLMKPLGVNTVRVYTSNYTENHDSCMATFEDAGIYVMVGLDSVNDNISPEDPQWNIDLYTQFTKTLDAFSTYDNLLGVFLGSEIVNNASAEVAAPYIKAAARDIKAYRDSRGYRKIPVGYAGADVLALTPWLQNYLACGSNDADAIDFFGQNQYSWCGDSSYTESGYDVLTANASIYNIPIFFSETGCNTPDPRTFTDQTAIFGPEMAPVWSGAIIYEWFQEANNYGLVEYQSDDEITPISPDYFNLKSQWAANTPVGTASSLYSPSNTPPPCPTSTAGGWSVAADAALPTISGLTIPPPSSTSASSSSHTGHSISRVRPSTTSTTSTTSTPGPESSSQISLNSSSGGISTGVKAAIGVLIPLAVIAFLMLLLWGVRYRRKQKARVNLAIKPSTDTLNDHSKPELEAGTVRGIWGPVAPKAELNAAPYMEKSAMSQELPDRDIQPSRPEMAASPILQHSSSPAQLAAGDNGQPSNALIPVVANRPQTSEAPWQHDFTYRSSSAAEGSAPDRADAAVAELSSISVKRKALAKATPVDEASDQKPVPTAESKDAEIARLMKEQERINEERERIKALQELDRKEAEIRERLDALS